VQLALNVTNAKWHLTLWSATSYVRHVNLLTYVVKETDTQNQSYFSSEINFSFSFYIILM